ncbi:MAG: YceI family protein [Aquabacterium sp.]|nr:YceI family protein [Aquabacterium sp.]
MTLPNSLAPLGMAAFAALLAAPVAAQQVVPAQSEIAFVSRQMGVPVEGRFRKWEAQIAFDPRKPEAGRVSFTIDMGSASFGSAETDSEVPKAAWFHVERFPKASFQSTAIKAAGAGRYEVAGKLTLKGLSRDLVVPVTLAQAGAQGTASGQFALKRLDFKIGEGEWADTSMVANDVNVRFKLALSGLASP